MTRNRLLLYLAFALYQVISFVFTILVDGHLDLLGLLKFIPWFKYITFLGVTFILIDFVWFWVDQRTEKQRLAELEKENNVLKAKIYDFQEASKAEGTSKG